MFVFPPNKFVNIVVSFWVNNNLTNVDLYLTNLRNTQLQLMIFLLSINIINLNFFEIEILFDAETPLS